VNKAAILYNPVAGRSRARRLADVERAATVLRHAGVETLVAPTGGRAAAGQQARAAVAAGCDTVFAAGGDGTVHDVLQGMIGQNAALAILPLGTANSLAADLRIPRDPVRAARFALASQPRQVTVGNVEYAEPQGQRASRYFLVNVGVGADAHLFYAMNMKFKDRIGVSAYYAEALRVWATHSYPAFEAEFNDCATGELRREIVTQVLAVRIANFGGLLRRLAPGAALRRHDLRLVLFKTGARLTYLHYMTRVFCGLPGPVPGVELVNSTRLECRHLQAGQPVRQSCRIYAEADGELLGLLPTTVEVVPGAVRLLAGQANDVD
jgi:diacylglycerol kinase family enzyme